MARKSFSCRGLLRLLGLPWPPKVSALSTGPGTGSEKVPWGWLSIDRFVGRKFYNSSLYCPALLRLSLPFGDPKMPYIWAPNPNCEFQNFFGNFE